MANYVNTRNIVYLKCNCDLAAVTGIHKVLHHHRLNGSDHTLIPVKQKSIKLPNMLNIIWHPNYP